MAKYKKVVGYWVYSIYVPSVNKYYIGVSKQQCCQRWCKSAYKDTSLAPYLSEWESMEKTVLVDNLSKKDAFIYEGNIIRALQMNNLCINEQRSGLFRTNDKNAYVRELLKTNTEYREHEKQRKKQWYENNKEKEKKRSKQWRENNKQRVKQYYENNKEKINEKRRQRRLKKKLENNTSLQQ